MGATEEEYRDLLVKFVPRPILSKKDYRRALAQLEQLMVPHPPPAQGLLIELLAVLVAHYEAQQR